MSHHGYEYEDDCGKCITDHTVKQPKLSKVAKIKLQLSDLKLYLRYDKQDFRKLNKKIKESEKKISKLQTSLNRLKSKRYSCK